MLYMRYIARREGCAGGVKGMAYVEIQRCLDEDGLG
jgi:hypothetical protein